MVRYAYDDAGPCEASVSSSQITSASVGTATRTVADTSARSALLTAADTIGHARSSDHTRSSDQAKSSDRARSTEHAILGDRAGPSTDSDDAYLHSAATALRSWVVGWTHRFEPVIARRASEPTPAGVRRLVEAVIDVLLERRPAEQVKRWVSREVFALLSAVTQRRVAARFAARSMVRSIQMYVPGPDAVESTVLVQDGTRVRAVALRFERVNIQRYEPANGVGGINGGINSGNNSGISGGTNGQGRLEWRCTALQFA